MPIWSEEAQRNLVRRPTPEGQVKKAHKISWSRINDHLSRGLALLKGMLFPESEALIAGFVANKETAKALIHRLPPESLAILGSVAEMMGSLSKEEWLMAVYADRGGACAVEVAIRLVDWNIDQENGRYKIKQVINRALDDVHLSWMWGQLREAIVRLPLAEHQAVAESLAPFRETLDPLQRCMLGYFFPMQAWVEEDVKAQLTEPLSFLETVFFTTDISVASALVLWDRHSGHRGMRYSTELVRLLGDDAFEPLKERFLFHINPTSGTSEDLRPLVQALALFPAAAPFLAPHLEHGLIGPLVQAFFHHHPAEAVVCYAESLGQRSKTAQKPAELLSSLARLHPSVVLAALPRIEPRLAARVERLTGNNYEEAAIEELPEWLQRPPWHHAPAAWAELPLQSPPREIDELLVHAIQNRNRLDDPDAYFLGKKERIRQVVTVALAAHPARAQAIGLLRWLNILDKDILSLIATADKQAVNTCLGLDPLFECPAEAPRLPRNLRPEGLPRPLLKTGQIFPASVMRSLVEMMAFTPRAPAYEGIARLKEICEPLSLENFAWSLGNLWIEAGAQNTMAWQWLAIGHLGAEASARKLTTFVRKQIREKEPRLAMAGVEALAMLSGGAAQDVALMHLAALARAPRKGEVEARAEQLLQQAARQRGLSGEALEECLVPDLELAPDGTTELDYGPRKIQVRFDEHLEPALYENNERLRAIPKGSKTDDPEKVAIATERWKGLKADTRTLITQVRRRLDRAMVQRRLWRGSSFQSLFLRHPLLSLVARRLVWGVWDNGHFTAFRIAEDLTLANRDDQHFVVGERAWVGIPHPLELPDQPQWSSLLEDYTILQPFPQVNREVFHPLPEELERSAMTGLTARKALWNVMRGALEGRGWEMTVVKGHPLFERRAHEARVSLTVQPNPFRSPPDEEVLVGSVLFDTRIKNVPKVLYSEARRDVEMFNSQGSGT